MATKKASTVPVGIGPKDRVLYEHLQNHIQAEAGMEDLYDTLAATGHPYITFLANLIGEDESRHHRLFGEWMEALRAEAEMDESKGGIPMIDRKPITPEIVALVERLLEFEKADLTAVKKLRKDIADVADTTLWGALLETLEADTKKHIGILKFLKRQLRAAR